MIFGGDYSKWDGVLDWVNHTWRHAFVKVSEGYVEDTMFKAQWRSSKGYAYRGGYHFFRPLVSWKAAAEKFMLLMDREGLGELPPVLDFEAVDGVSAERLCEYGLEWLRHVHRESGQRPIVYTSPGFSDSNRMHGYADFADYPLWQATYPFDTITSTWSEGQRGERLHDIVLGVYPFSFPIAARPWRDFNRRATFVQFTGKMPPEFVPGYPLGNKKAVDVNAYKGTLEDLIVQFDLPILEGGVVSAKPITWKATLKAGMSANLRIAAGTAAGIKETIQANRNLFFEGTGAKVNVGGYWWAEVTSIDGIAKSGWIAFTTSFMDVVWITVPTAQKRAIKSTIEYDDGTTDVMYPRT